ncbi:MAG: hypothetical protein NW226_06970 [Microscillaceae bacterium]|nr:hypothetical protein [Microscillaceae bacterium]
MKFSDFSNIADMLEHFGLNVETKRFIDFDKLVPIEISNLLKEDIDFVLAERGDTDMEYYACEALIFPLLKEAWKRNPKAKLFSHPQIKFEDLILVPDYVVTPRNKTGVNIFEKPLLITVEAKNDDYERGWADAYRQLIVARFLNENPDIPIYAIVSIGTGWQIGKLDGKTIFKHPLPLGLDNPNRLLGMLDFIFADCVRTAEKFNMY